MALASVVQMQSGSDIAENIKKTREAVRQAADAGAKLVALPEEFLTLGLTREAKKACSEPFQDGPLQSAVSVMASEYQIWIVAGTLPLQAQNGKLSASCLLFDDKGVVQARYDKLHLFDVTVSESERYCESDAFEPGKDIVVAETPIGRVGLSICYDIRFPELYRAMHAQDVEVILAPSAFTIPTGQAHWEVLLRARAIENLAFVLAPNEAGFRDKNTGTYGHSMIIDPWGELLQQAKQEEIVLTTEIDLDKMHKIRSEFPAISHRQNAVISALKESIDNE